MICFKFRADEKPVWVMPLQSEDYSEASSNLYDQLKWTKETRLLEISTSAFFVKLIFNVIIVLLIIPLPPSPPKKKSVEF